MIKNALRAFIFLFLLLILNNTFCQTLSPHFLIKSYGILNNNIKPDRDNIIANDASLSVTPPDISYETPQNYVLNQPITTLVPANTGGTVPVTIYGQLSTVTGGLGTVTGVASDANGNVYAADWNRNQIKKISINGTTSLFAGSGVQGTANGQGTTAMFYEPDALVFDHSGNLYVSDQGNQIIRKITPSGLVSTFAGSGSLGSVNGTGIAASFNNPRGMTIDDLGNLYVADQGNNLIRKISPAGIVSTFAGSGAAGFTNGTKLAATFNTPTAVAIDAAGNLYIADAGNGAVRKITTGGQVSTIAAGLHFPRELRVDGTGNIYVAEQESYSIKRISPDGTAVTIVNAGLSGPIGLSLDGKGNLFLGDVSSVKKVVISGYTIDKPLPAGLSFDPKTGTISGTPTTLSSSTNYTVTAYNGGGSSTTTLNIAVGLTQVLKPSIITLPSLPANVLDANNNYDPGAVSTNPETPVTYTSSNPAVAIVTPEGLIHVIAPGVTIITAHQEGNAHYADAVPVQQMLTIVQLLQVSLPPIAAKTVCDADFSANANSSVTAVPLTYSSSNPAVATISDQGIIHLTGAGTTTITVSQNTSSSLYESAVPQSEILTVTLPSRPDISIAAQYAGLCAGSQITFTAIVNNGGSHPAYQWKINGNDTGISTSTFTSNTLATDDVVTCICTNTDDVCIAGFPVTSGPVKVNLITPSVPAVTITASVNNVFPGIPVTITAITGNAAETVSYQWKVNGNDAGANNPVFTSKTFINGDIVTCTITTATACSLPVTSQPLRINIVTKLEIPNTFTPNADGINDTWNISGIASYPDCVVTIYNRYGSLVYKSDGYHQAWDGTANGSGVPVSTYYYIIDLKSERKKLSGLVTIIR